MRKPSAARSHFIPRPARAPRVTTQSLTTGAHVTDIFLSYNREDQARAKLFAEAFEGQGFKVWWDVGLRTGEAYDEVTEKALRTAKAVVVLWSKKSVPSRWVRAEATLAGGRLSGRRQRSEKCGRHLPEQPSQRRRPYPCLGSSRRLGWS
jgi:TIR domain